MSGKVRWRHQYLSVGIDTTQLRLQSIGNEEIGHLEGTVVPGGLVENKLIQRNFRRFAFRKENGVMLLVIDQTRSNRLSSVPTFNDFRRRSGLSDTIGPRAENAGGAGEPILQALD